MSYPRYGTEEHHKKYQLSHREQRSYQYYPRHGTEEHFNQSAHSDQRHNQYYPWQGTVEHPDWIHPADQFQPYGNSFHFQPHDPSHGNTGALPTYHPPKTKRCKQPGREHVQVNKEKATKLWVECVNDWYPGFQEKVFFLPPLHFRKVPYDVENIEGQTALIPKIPSDQVHEALGYSSGEEAISSHDSRTTSPSSNQSFGIPEPPLPAQVWLDHPVARTRKKARVLDSDWRDDEALKCVLSFIEQTMTQKTEGMMVVSRLLFRKYLDKLVCPVRAAIIRTPPDFPKPVELDHLQDGEFDILIISRKYGFVVCEVKSVGADHTKTENLDQSIADRVTSAVRQLDRATDALMYMVSDLATVRITRTLMMPNISSSQLQQALGNNGEVAQELCRCLGASDPATAVCRSVCSDDISDPASSTWWQRTVTDHGHDTNMTFKLYEILVARFCGPATSIEVPTVSHPRRAVELKTLPEAVALTGLQMALLTLYPNQVQLLTDAHRQRVFLLGPPGTGKTVVLVLKALQWLHQGNDVHLVSSHRNSRAAILLIENQLHYMLLKSRDMDYRTVGCVHRHMYDFEARKTDVTEAVETLASAAQGGQLFVIVDEALNDPKFSDFCDALFKAVTNLHIWAAAVLCDDIPLYMKEEFMKIPIRCPPTVASEVQRSVYIHSGVVPLYESSELPTPTDGPKVSKITHCRPESDTEELLPGHSGRPWECSVCAVKIADLVVEIVHHKRKDYGHIGHDLGYRDVFILCHFPRRHMPVVTSLQERGVPVEVVTTDEDDDTIQKVVLAEENVVIVTNWRVVSGLERRIVIVERDERDRDKLFSMSRTTSLLVIVH